VRQCGGDTSVNVAAMAREMSRVLRPGGVFVMARSLFAHSKRIATASGFF
jgi:ubiquinone/menaquinone biosynthesis C-methylase UbiE